jgi:hypothetical protein
MEMGLRMGCTTWRLASENSESCHVAFPILDIASDRISGVCEDFGGKGGEGWHAWSGLGNLGKDFTHGVAPGDS